MAGAVILDGKAIARQMLAQLQRERAQLPEPPQLRVLFFDQPASRLFWQAQHEAAKMIGIEGTGQEHSLHPAPWRRGSVELPWEHVTQQEVERLIERWNEDARVHGIFVHQPMPPRIDAQRLSALIDPQKDVEGIHPANSARRFFAKARIGSCTALAVLRLIEQTGVELEGKEAVVVGHSEIVGRPVSMLLLDKLATTTICHLGTDHAGHLDDHVRRADVLVAAVGRPRLIKGAWIKPGAIVIDVGVTVVNGRVVGDVEFEEATQRAAWITPVPGGVGPVTVMMVMQNTIAAYKLQRAQASVGR
jgi:methylenetetrahydrofolate dehydrogenase (NADP+)/methenyltetrahydrofolate cyclohydrolase